MKFQQKDKLSLSKQLSDLSNSQERYLGESSAVLEVLSSALLRDVANVRSIVLNQIPPTSKYDEKARTAVFYAFLKMLGLERLNQYENVLFAKEAGLKLGLNAIGVDQVIHQLRTEKISMNDFSTIANHFKLYLN